MKDLYYDLKNHLEGDVLSDTLSRNIYSVDASMYSVTPTAVVIPKAYDDLLATVMIAKKHHSSIVPRGAGTGVTGSCLGKSLVVDCSKYLNKILDINIEKGYALCEPGVVLDELNTVLSPMGYQLACETASGNRATLGGMLGNNSSGAQSLRYGCTSQHVESVEMVLSTAETFQFEALSTEKLENKILESTTEGHIYREVSRILKDCQQDIENFYPKGVEHTQGYNLGALTQSKPLNLAKLIAGSEGTLGITSKIKFKIVKKPKQAFCLLLCFSSLKEAIESLELLKQSNPLALEFIDETILHKIQNPPIFQKRFSWVNSETKALVVLEKEAHSPEDLEDKKNQLEKISASIPGILNQRFYFQKEDIKKIKLVKYSGMELLLSQRSLKKDVAFIENLTIPHEYLIDFINQLQKLLQTFNKKASIYGHLGHDCVHLRPYVNLYERSNLNSIHLIINKVLDLVGDYRGFLSASQSNEFLHSQNKQKIFGEKLYCAFCDIKAAFDPDMRMNPGKIIGSHSLKESLRVQPRNSMKHIPTFLDFSLEGGIEKVSDLCTGGGRCRKLEGIMCPSYQASRDERFSTRGRAQSLRSLIHGNLSQEAFTHKEFHKVLDLCIECKACARECPSGVNMTKIKSEFLYHYQEKHGYLLRDRFLAHLDTVAKYASYFPKFSNFLQNSSPGKKVLECIGFSPQRNIPNYAGLKFSTWYKRNYKSKKRTQKVVLLNDSYTEFYAPHIGIAAINILDYLGFDVIVPPRACCGRPSLSKGFLPRARLQAQQLLQNLSPFVEQKMPILGLEPSCLYTLLDDYRYLLPASKVKPLIACTQSIDSFLGDRLSFSRLSPERDCKQLHIAYHSHCHQSSSNSKKKSLNLLSQIPLAHVQEIPEGCCGMSQFFGYEKEHYDFSLKIANQKLFPCIQKMEQTDLIISNGFCCRNQIKDGTEKNSLHLVEILAESLGLSSSKLI